MPTATVEDYVKRIYALQVAAEGHGDAAAPVPMGVLAEALGVAPGTVTAMIKRLSDRQLVDYAPYTGVRLTDTGRTLALDVLRRHRLIESFLVDVLGLDWSEVHEEAERLEHAVSDKLLAAIDRRLGHPVVDPHGDPIPTAAGEMPSTDTVSLDRGDPGGRVRITRVLDQDEAFLRYVDELGLRPGAEVGIVRRDPLGETIHLTGPDGRDVVLGRTAAGRLLGEVID